MKKLFTLSAFLLMAAFCHAQAQLPGIKLAPFSDGYNMPIGIENAGDDRLFIIERPGKIFICSPSGEKSADPFLDISAKVIIGGDEQGLLGLAFHPNYTTNGFFYVDYINLDGYVSISRFKVSNNDPNVADAGSEEVMLVIKKPWPNHNGGCLKFGPDGYLYIGVGDGGREGDPLDFAQNRHVLLGKILRIDVDGGSPYAIPPTNPFVNSATFAHEIWAYGLRNPWRFSFDKLNGNLWIGDVGQDKWEEVDLQAAGAIGGTNYGWDCTEGHHPFDTEDCNSNTKIKLPIAEYSHDEGACTIIGGFVYRGSQFSKMYGKYFTMDYCSGTIRTVFKTNNGWQIVPVGQDEFGYTSFGEDIHGELYVASEEEGEIERVVDTSAVDSMKFANILPQSASLFPNPNNGSFTVEWNSQATGNYAVEITTLPGQQVLTETREAEPGMNAWEFSTKKLTAGNYLLVIHTDDGLIRKKFTIEE